jgi:hypothetical protein
MNNDLMFEDEHIGGSISHIRNNIEAKPHVPIIGSRHRGVMLANERSSV